jgi:undecaprenyl diphosphate synthase
VTATDDRNDIDLARIPRHVAIIMDGNGRWAAKKGLPRAKGHEAGAQSVRAVLETCRDLPGIESLSLYAFSTENWKRSKAEVSTLFRLMSRYIRNELDALHREGVQVFFSGRREGLPDTLVREMETSEQRTAENRALKLNLCVNYGGRSELVDAARSIARDVNAGRLQMADIDESAIAQRLYFPPAADLDLLIRTSGELRVSNFMLWQISYAEVVVTPTLWPDFRRRHFLRAIAEYQERTRNFGGRAKK